MMTQITPEDLDEMLRQFNDNAEKMQATHLALQQQVIELKRELKEKDQALQRKRRLEALGEMAAGVAHEIRNPLGGIQLYADMLTKDLESKPDNLRVVNKIAAAVHHLDTIVEDLLAFTKNMEPVFQLVDVHQVLENALSFVASAVNGKAVQIFRNYDKSVPQLRADAHLLQRAFLNILLNAEQAIDGEGSITISTTVEDSEVFIVFADSGPGIPEDILDKIFNPFFTKKDKGTGLGLAIVHRIVESHQANIIARNQPAGGAEFILRFIVDGG